MTNSFTIYDETAINALKTNTAAIETSVEPLPETSTKNEPKRAAWQIKYTELKKRSKDTARDYLIEIIGHDDFPQVLKQPEVKPQVLLQDRFDLLDPLSIWRRFITEDDCTYITSQTNANARIVRGKVSTQHPGKARSWKDITTPEISAYIGALFVLGTQGAASLVDNWACSEDSPLFPLLNYISCKRFQQISRFIKIHRPGEGNDNLKDKDFWLKVDPLVSSFRQRCRSNLRPGNVFAIDEQYFQ